MKIVLFSALRALASRIIASRTNQKRGGSGQRQPYIHRQSRCPLKSYRKAVCQRSLWARKWRPAHDVLIPQWHLEGTLSPWDSDRPCPSEDSLWPDLPRIGSLVPTWVRLWMHAIGRRGTEQRLQEALGLPVLSAKEAAGSMCLMHMCFLQDKALAFFY